MGPRVTRRTVAVMRALAARVRAKINRRWIAGGVGVVLLAGLAAWAVWPADPGYRTVDERV